MESISLHEIILVINFLNSQTERERESNFAISNYFNATIEKSCFMLKI